MEGILSKIGHPADLKRLSPAQRERLAAEIREELVSTVTQTGGHLASNLGVVELTIALHSAFDSPRDKLLWDVGHQAYVHKLLTGRRERFATLRQYGGLSGFPDPEESPHDAFIAGHAGIIKIKGLYQGHLTHSGPWPLSEQLKRGIVIIKESNLGEGFNPGPQPIPQVKGHQFKVTAETEKA